MPEEEAVCFYSRDLDTLSGREHSLITGVIVCLEIEVNDNCLC